MLRPGALCVLLVLVACSDGGGSSGGTSIPALDWAGFRRDGANSGVGRGSVGSNSGTVELLTADLGGVTSSTPVIGRDRRMYIGTGDGLLALDDDGNTRWRFDVCALPADGDCSAGTCVEVGSISSSAAVTPDDDIVVASDGTGGIPGHIFRIHDDGDSFTCVWRFRPLAADPDFGVHSSPLAVIDGTDLSLLSAFVGTNEGRLRALGGDGSPTWQFPARAPLPGDLSSTPATGAFGGLFVQSPDGFLYALDFAGRSLWRFETGRVESSSAFLPSPAVASAVYAVGSGPSVVAVNPDGTLKWRVRTLAPVPGSPSVAGDVTRELKCSDSNLNCRSDADCPTETCSEGRCTQSGKDCDSDEDCPTETCRAVDVFDTAIRVVDGDGTLYGIRDTGGTLAVFRRCSGSNSDNDCDDDDDCDAGQVCEERTALLPMWSGGPIAVSASPIVSADLFNIVASEDGLVCARRLDGTVPDAEVWQTGCVSIGGGARILSSPILDQNGRIYVSTDLGLYVIR
jgi:outer membrane protein assembly factor BamB